MNTHIRVYIHYRNKGADVIRCFFTTYIHIITEGNTSCIVWYKVDKEQEEVIAKKQEDLIALKIDEITVL